MDNKSQKEKFGIVNILGVNITKAKISQINTRLVDYLDSQEPHLVTTPNPEIVLKASGDEEYFTIINRSHLAVPDGIGLKFAAWTMGENLYRYTGVDLSRHILALAEKKGRRVAVFNLKGGLSTDKEISGYLKKNFPKLDFIVEAADKNWAMGYYQNINIFKPQIVLANQGNPEQEKFLYHQLGKWPFVQLAIGVGGTFDFLLGKVSAPRFFRRLGLEWLWRALSLPKYNQRKKRLKRIFNATIVFTYKFLRWRFVLPFFYRQNVMCMLFKKEQGKKYFFLVERSDQPGHWQFPQGGLDGLSVQDAGFKELSEESGTKKFEFVATYGFFHRYRFPFDSPLHRGAVYEKNCGYKGQKQALYIAEFSGLDRDIKINYWDHKDWMWVEEEKVLDTVFSYRQESVKKALELFNILLAK